MYLLVWNVIVVMEYLKLYARLISLKIAYNSFLDSQYYNRNVHILGVMEMKFDDRGGEDGYKSRASGPLEQAKIFWVDGGC